ncbi:MAG: hypothetical protein ABI175_14600, partial [Polyangiales bacterium]
MDAADSAVVGDASVDSAIVVRDATIDAPRDVAPETAVDARPDVLRDEGADVDGGDPIADRRLNVVFAQPDAPPLFMCLGAFAADPTAAARPVSALGPAGVPDPLAPTDPFKLRGYEFGSTLGYPVREAAARAAFTSLITTVYFLARNPLTEVPPRTCADMWDGVRADTKRWVKIPAGTITAGKSFLLALLGCERPSPTGEC